MKWLVGIMLLVSPGQTRAQAAAGDSLAEALFRRLHPPALSIALVRADSDAERWQIGEADLAQHRQAGRDTRFRIGSDSKLFTAAITARLAAAGTLDLDAPIARYLPKLPAAYRNLTARQLAGHLAGVRHYGPGEFIS
jgi:serine beta-lactamase-like protein LACTB